MTPGQGMLFGIESMPVSMSLPNSARQAEVAMGTKLLERLRFESELRNPEIMSKLGQLPLFDSIIQTHK